MATLTVHWDLEDSPPDELPGDIFDLVATALADGESPPTSPPTSPPDSPPDSPPVTPELFFTFTDTTRQFEGADLIWLGPMVEIQPDSYNGAPTTPAMVGEEWGIPYSLTTEQREAFRAQFFPGGGRGYKYVRLPHGFAYRGYRRINSESGLADRIGPRFPDQDESLKHMCALISDVTNLTDKNAGGGIAFSYWSPSPHFKTTQAYPGGLASVAGGSSVAMTGTYKISNPVEYAARLAEFAEMILDDMEYVHQNIAPIKIFGIWNEAGLNSNSPYGSWHPANGEFAKDLWKEVTPLIRNSVVLADLTLYGGGPGQNEILFHHDSLNGNFGSGSSLMRNDTEVLSTGKTILKELWGWSLHKISEIGGRNTGQGQNAGGATTETATDIVDSGADYIRVHGAGGGGWLSNRGGAGGIAPYPRPISDEQEYFSAALVTPARWRFTNTAMIVLNWINYVGAPTTCPMIHVGKPPLDPQAIGFGMVIFRPQVPFNVMGGPEYADIDPQHYKPVQTNYGALKWMLDELSWDAKILTVSESALDINRRVMGWRNTDGVVRYVAVNRTNFAKPIRMTFASAKTLSGVRYTLNAASPEMNSTTVETSLGTVTSVTSIDRNLAPWSIELWREL